MSKLDRKDNIVDKNVKENYTEEGFILPNHYMSGKYQMIDIIKDQLTPVAFWGFNKFYCIKYLMRVASPSIDFKTKLRAYKKANYYLNELVSNYAKEFNFDISKNIESNNYKNHSLEVVDIVEDQFDSEELIGAYTGTILKYILRARHKEGFDDYKKAQWFLNRLINYVEGLNGTI